MAHEFYKNQGYVEKKITKDIYKKRSNKSLLGENGSGADAASP